MIDRLNTLPAGCFLLLAMSAVTAPGQAETELEFSYSDEWSVVSAPPPSGPYRAVHVDPRVPGQGVTPPLTAGFDAGGQADTDAVGATGNGDTAGEVAQQAISVDSQDAAVDSAMNMEERIEGGTTGMQEAATVTEQVAVPVAAPAAVAAEEQVQRPPVASITHGAPSAEPADIQVTTGQPAAADEAAAVAVRPAAPSGKMPAGDSPLATQLPVPGMMDSMPPPAAGHSAIRQPSPPAAARDDAQAGMLPPVPGQYGQMQTRPPAYGYPQSGRQGGGYPQSGWQGSGYPQSGWQGSDYPQSGWQGSGHPGYRNTPPYGYYRGPDDMSGAEEVPPPGGYQVPPYYGGNTYPGR